MNWLVDHWSAAVSIIFGGSGLATLVRFGPRVLRRLALMLDCELDRVRWEEADKLRNREIALLRQDVTNLQNDIARLQARLVASGAASAGVANNGPTSSTSKPTRSGT